MQGKETEPRAHAGAREGDARHQALLALGRRAAEMEGFFGEAADECAHTFELTVFKKEKGDPTYVIALELTPAELWTRARHHAKDCRRHEERIHSHELPLPPPDVLDRLLAAIPVSGASATPEEELEQREVRARLYRALETLTENQRLIVRRYDLDGEEMDLIARSLDLSRRAAHECRRRGLKRLRLWFERHSM